MKRLIIFLLFILSACVTTTNQPTERIKEDDIYPIVIPIQLSYKPAKINFTMNMKFEKQEQRYNGIIVVSQFGESLMWKSRVNLNPRVFIEIKCLSDVYGDTKECDSPIANISLKPEERKEIDNLAEIFKLQSVATFPDKPFISGEELINFYQNEEGTETDIKGIVKGQGFVNNRKVLIVDVSGSVNNSLKNQSISIDGYFLFDLETAHVVKYEINGDNGRFKMSYKATIAQQ